MIQKEEFKKAELNIDNLFSDLAQGLNRAYLFNGIIQNADYAKLHSNPSKAIHPLYGTQLSFVDMSKATIEHTKPMEEALKDWAILNGIREIMESFDAFFNKIYFHLRLISEGARITPEKLKESHEELKSLFEDNYIGKLKKIRKIIPINQNIFDFLVAMQDIRNCISHDRYKMFRKKTDNLKIKIPYFQALWIKPNGEEIEIEMGEQKAPLQGPARLVVALKNKEKNFKKGEAILFSIKEFVEICTNINSFIVPEFKKQIFEYFKKNNIPIETKTPLKKTN